MRIPLFHRFVWNRQRRRTRYDSNIRQLVRRVERIIRFALTEPLGFLLRPRRTARKLDLADVKAVLILRYDALGDVIQATPVWRSLKKHAPHIRIGVVGSVRNQSLLHADPDIDEVYIFSRTPGAFEIKEMIRARKSKWDVVLNLYFHDKTRAAIYSKLVAPRGISVTISREKLDKYRKIYSIVGERPALHPATPMVLQNLIVLQTAVDISLEELDRRLSLVLPQATQDEAGKLIASRLSAEQSFIVLNTDASQSYREWGFANSHNLCKSLAVTFPDIRIFWTSAPVRTEGVKAFLDANPIANSEYLSTPSILILAGVIRRASLVISPDTSVIHIAAAFGKPVVGLYPEETEFMPYATESRVLFAPHGNSVADIPVEDVFLAVTNLLSNNRL